jgi:hypothetical protein
MFLAKHPDRFYGNWAEETRFSQYLPQNTKPRLFSETGFQ